MSTALGICIIELTNISNMIQALTLKLLFFWRTIDIEHQAVMEHLYKWIFVDIF